MQRVSMYMHRFRGRLKMTSGKWGGCMQDTFARATHLAYAAARPSARATIGYLVYKWGGGGFVNSDMGGGVVCESSDVRKFLKKSKFQNFSELFIAFLFSKCNCIQHLKLYKNRNWAINFVLMSKNKNRKCVIIEKCGRPGRGWFWKFGHTRTRGGRVV